MSVDRRRQMIAVNHSELSLARQCELVSIARSSYYYRPKNESESEPVNENRTHGFEVQCLI